MEIDDEGQSLGWCFGVSSLCAAVGSTGSLLLDSGSNELSITGQKIVPMVVGPTGGKQSLEATATCCVAEVRGLGCESWEPDGRNEGRALPKAV